MTVTANVRLLGVFQALSRRKRVRIKLDDGATIMDLIQKLVESLPPEFEKALIDPVLGEPQPNALILVNGKEVSVLNGAKTVVKDGDEVVLVPVTHGG